MEYRITENYLELETIDKKTRCLYPFKAKFLLTYRAMHSCSIEMTQITFWKLIPEIIKQSVIAIYLKILRRLRFWGFLKTTAMQILSLKDFTFKFWKYKIKR